MQRNTNYNGSDRIGSSMKYLKIVALNHSSHCAVENEDTFAEQGVERVGHGVIMKNSTKFMFDYFSAHLQGLYGVDTCP